MKIKTLFCACISVALLALMTACGSGYTYETVKGDPMKTRIYTLDNGLKVYVSVNKETPRIQTYIGVRVGGKNDPAESTGLAHYFEHLMFKGSESFGTQDYAAEKPLLDQIEQQFERYRTLTDEGERRAAYAVIDSLSYAASEYAIPNEYDKLMSAIGAEGTNAYTGYDMTVYVEDIPANQVENWLRIEADRFRNNVIRGFHTELETVYEEKNMSLTSDNGKVMETLFATLFPGHPYGMQVILGTQDHLKNPSITTIKQYHKTWYVPNNMAICMAGDLDPDATIALVDKYFGSMEPNPELPAHTVAPLAPITAPISKEIVGLDADNITIGWRLPGVAAPEIDIAEMIRSILYNGRAGLIDLDLVQQQKVLSAIASNFDLVDHGVMQLKARPKAGQTLDELKDLLLAEMDKLRRGDFDERLLTATVDNYKANFMRRLDSNDGRADLMVNSFINGVTWKEEVEYLSRLEKITKQQVVDYAAQALRDDNYVVIYKRQGKDETIKKIDKPQITPIRTNRDVSSAFLAEIIATPVTPIQPVFLDYDRDLSKGPVRDGVQLLYKQNPTNDLFTLTYLFETGTNDNPAIVHAFNYLRYLGTDSLSAEQIKQQFYNLAGAFNLQAGSTRSYVTIRGLGKNMEQTVALVESLLSGAKADPAILETLKTDLKKSRSDAKLNQRANHEALSTYAKYGPDYIRATTLPAPAIDTLSADYLLSLVRGLSHTGHRILYYGPEKQRPLAETLARLHTTPAELAPAPESRRFLPVPTESSRVLLAEYDANNLYYTQQSNLGGPYDPANDALEELFNEYFGGSMNSIVFQEMREARGLAYSAKAWLDHGAVRDEPYTFRAFIATQNDKMAEAIAAFSSIIQDMPRSQKAFDLAQESLIARMRTDRTVKNDILWSYVDALDMGVDYDRRRTVFETAQTLTLDSLEAYQQAWIKDRPCTHSILGRSADLDMTELQARGTVTRLSQEEIFGY